MELLSPAGSYEALLAAVQNGADAVYLGLGGFNARRSAKNFTDEDFAAGRGLLPRAWSEGLSHPEHPAHRPGAARGGGGR